MTRKYDVQFWGTPKERFFNRTQRTETCWWWKGSKDRGGYGVMKIRQKQIGAHRFSYELYKGKIPPGIFVCHSCDNRLCVNPAHLWLGTPQENTDDMKRKGRMKKTGMKGEDNPKAKLNRQKVAEIRNMYRTGLHTHRSLAKQFSMSHTSIGYILRMEAWTN